MSLPEPIASAVEPPRILAPAADLFSRRAARLRALAPAHPLERWFLWLADLADAQQREADALGGDGLSLPEWQTVFARLSPALSKAGVAAALSADELAVRGEACLIFARGESAAEGRDVVDLVVAAALQVVRSASARARIAAADVHPGRRDQCPCCGSAAVASMVMAGDGKGGVRYLECALCATRWHAVRAHCSLCESTGRVDYCGIEGSERAVQAETCDACHGYLKLLFQERAPGMDPVADDLASLALDVLVGEQGYLRAAPNLYLLTGEAV